MGTLARISLVFAALLLIPAVITAAPATRPGGGGGGGGDPVGESSVCTNGQTILADTGAWVCGTPAGGGDLLAANNLSELTATASTARANIGLTIGTHVQAHSAKLDTLVTDLSDDLIDGGSVVAASDVSRGVVTVNAQTFAGAKTFNGGIVIPRTATLEVACDPALDVCTNRSYLDAAPADPASANRVQWGFTGDDFQWFPTGGALQTAARLQSGNLDLGTGTIRGAVSVENTGSTTHSLTAFEGQWLIADESGTTTINLANITAAGQNFCVYASTAQTVIVNPDDSDTITYEATTDTAGHQIAGPATTIGAYACFLATTTSNWAVLGKSGTWVPGS